jgi:hypothetical protein
MAEPGLLSILILPGCAPADLEALDSWLGQEGIETLTGPAGMPGVGQDWRETVEKARGRWLWLLGPGSRPLAFHPQACFFLKQAESVLIVSRARFHAPGGDDLGLIHPAHPASFTQLLQSWRQPPALEAVFWRREAWLQADGFDPALPPDWQAYDLACRLARRGGLLGLPAPLVSLPLGEDGPFWRQTSDPADGLAVAARHHAGPLSPRSPEASRLRARGLLARAARGSFAASTALLLAWPRLWFYHYAYPRLRDRCLRGGLKRLL